MFDFGNKTIKLNLLNLNYLSNNYFTYSVSNFNVYNNLHYAKQNRWLLKNSLLSNNSISHLYYITQTKNFIGNTLYNSLNTSQNIWNSSKLTQLSKTSELINLSFFQNNNILNMFNSNKTHLTPLNTSSSTLQNFNLFENSQLWNTKKYFFTNQLKSQVSHLHNLPNQDPAILNIGTNNIKWVTLFNYLNISFIHQVKGLFTSTNLLSTDNVTNQSAPFLNKFLLPSVDFDFLKTTNTSFLLHLTTINNSFSIPVYLFSSNKLINYSTQTKLNFYVK
jgi:hypothetical protein